MILYHGTTSIALPSIAQLGLIPGKFHGADAYAKMVDPFGYFPPRDPSVFLAKVERVAEWYASMAIKVRHGKPLCLKVSVPSAITNKLITDEAEPDGNAVRYQGIVKPSWIISYKVGSGDWQTFKSLEHAA